LLDQSNFVGLTKLQYPVEINEFDFNFSQRLCFTLCVFGKGRRRKENPFGNVAAYGSAKTLYLFRLYLAT
jgi:hypothetical protein